jgi:hypothetical protein
LQVVVLVELTLAALVARVDYSIQQATHLA